MTASIVATVRAVEPEAQHGGSVYTRTVTLDIDGEPIDTFESKSYVTDEDIGAEVDAILRGSVTSVADLSPQTLGIQHPGDLPSGASKWRVLVTGEIISIETGGESEMPELLLGVGSGTIRIEPNEELSDLISSGSLEAGEVIDIVCSRIDIVGRHDSE